MAEVNINLKCDLQHAVKVQYLDGNLFSQDAAANIINIEVTDGGAPATIGGTVSANVIRPDGGTVAVTGGTISGNTVPITLPAACYALVGMITIVVKLSSDSVVTTLAAAVAYVYQSSTDTVVDPGTVVSSIQDLIDAIDTAVASIPADYSSLWTKLAPAFSSSTAYTAGQYVTYNGGLYRFTKAHAAGSWASGDVVAVNLGGELSDVKSAMRQITGNESIPYTVDNTYYLNKDVGSVGNTPQSSNNFQATIIDCAPGDVFTINGKGGSNGRLWAFLDSENKVTRRESSTDLITGKIITAETGEVKLVINNNKTNAPGYHSYYGNLMSLRIEKDENEIQNLKNDVNHRLDGYLYFNPKYGTNSYTTLNETESISIASGKRIVLIFNGYTGTKFTRLAVYGIKSDNTEDVITTFYSNEETAFEIDAPNAYKALAFQLVISSAESDVEYSVSIKADTGNMMGHDLLSLAKRANGTEESLSYLEENFDQMVYSYFNMTDLGMLTANKVYSHNSKIAVDNEYCYIVSPLRIKEGVTYYLKNLYIYFCTVVYDDGTKVALSDDTSDTTKTFTATKDGTIYLSIENASVGTQVMTTSLDFYNSSKTNTYYKAKHLEGLQTVFIVDKNGGGDYTKLKDAIAAAILLENVKVIVRPGTYDILDEYGSEYMESHTFTASDRGIELKNGIHLVFDSGAFVECKYIRVGGNPTVRRYFSPFNVSGSCTVENLNLEAAYCRYAVHDENGGNGTPYHVIWRGCQMKLYNWNSGIAINSGETGDESPWRSKKVIGGGLGKFGDILIENCYFDIMHTDSAGITAGIVTYHNNAGSNNPGSISRVVIRNCYFKQSTFRIMYHGTTDKITQALCCGNDFSAEPSSGPSGDGQTVVNVELYSWNNHIHETPTPEDPDWWD